MSLVRNLKGVTPALGPDYKWIGKRIEDSYKESNRTGIITKKTFSPSTLVWGHGACPRYWWYAFGAVEWRSVNSAREIAVMNYGTSRHGVLQEMIREWPEFIEDEREILSEDPPIRGFCDLVLRGPDGDEIFGEIKTTKHEAWVKRQMEGPAPYHIIQLGTYMKVQNVKRGFLLYESKNTQQILVFPVELDEKLDAELELMFEWMRTVRAAWKNKQMPQRVFAESSAKCKGCPVSKVCWSEGEGELAIAKMPLL